MTLVSTSGGSRRLSTPQGMQLGLVAVALAAILLGLALHVAISDQYFAVKTVCRDAAPSIVAAQHVAAGLADMEANLANELLVPPEDRAAWVKGFESRRHEATDALLSAAENITYGDAERGPIRTMLLQMPGFHGLASVARIHHARGDAGAAIGAYREAAALMTDTLMPAARALDQANEHVLDETYRSRASSATGMRLLVMFTALVLAGVLIALQGFVARRTRRLLNAGLLVAAALAVWLAGSSLVHLSASADHLRAAREDAFASVHLLWQARAVSYEANTDESRWLLDAERRDQYARDFAERAGRILKLPPGASAADLVATTRRDKLPAGVDGFIAGELRNITFPGELDAALKLLETRQAYMEDDNKVRRLELSGQHAEAVRFCTSYAPGDSNWAFDQSDTALGKVLEINETAFHELSAAGFAELEGLDAWTAVVCVLIPLAAFFGLRPRLREYSGV